MSLCHFTGENPGKPHIQKNEATITRHQPKKPCAPNRMADARSSNFGKLRFLRSVLKAEKNITKVNCWSEFELFQEFKFRFLCNSILDSRMLLHLLGLLISVGSLAALDPLL